jgi:riboflavin synthase
MFSGIIEELGQVAAISPASTQPATLTIRSTAVARAARPGHSIAVNGVTLTVARRLRGGFCVDLTADTLRRCTLGSLSPAAAVNLERAVTPSGLLGGHIVHGHPDATARVHGRHDDPNGTLLAIELPPGLDRYVIANGCIAVDGVSLTITYLATALFTVSLNPTTLAATTLGRVRPGALVTLEVDVLARHVERLLHAGARAAQTARR